MEDVYDLALENMENTVHTLASRVPSPQRVPYKDGFVFRYVERTLHQALVQMLARTVSSLHAARLLMGHGFAQEQASLQRILDEIQENVTFLSIGVIFNDISDLHERFLDAFFQEEFDSENALDSTQKRPMIPRQKIHAYIARMEGSPLDPSTGVQVARTISKAYSGYVHGASPHLMDMYGGDPPRFQVRGIRDSELHENHRLDLWNYFYRGLISFAFAAKAFGDEEMFTKIHEFTRDFERRSGKDYAPDT